MVCNNAIDTNVVFVAVSGRVTPLARNHRYSAVINVQ
jgi:hypothetical protein